MLDVKKAVEIVDKYVTDEAQRAELYAELMENDIQTDNTELDAIKAELEAERASHNETKENAAAENAKWVERFNRFVHGGDPGPAPEPEKHEDAVEEDEKTIYEEYLEVN